MDGEGLGEDGREEIDESFEEGRGEEGEVVSGKAVLKVRSGERRGKERGQKGWGRVRGEEGGPEAREGRKMGRGEMGGR